MYVFSFFLWPVCLQTEDGIIQRGSMKTTLLQAVSFWSLLATHSGAEPASTIPVKDESHELEVQGWRQLDQSDFAGGVLLGLTSLTEITIVSLQLLFLQRKETF